MLRLCSMFWKNDDAWFINLNLEVINNQSCKRDLLLKEIVIVSMPIFFSFTERDGTLINLYQNVSKVLKSDSHV